jgi:single-stranded-DNA-specific exonuclease
MLPDMGPACAMLNAISFRSADNALGRALMENRGRTVHLAGSLTLDRWQGAERVQLRILDMAQAGPMSGSMSAIRM